MRLHHLEITGFGPFADTTRIDFDALSDAGLFLLTGPTGAGKSSVLDAVCFALYGDVPGDRSTAKRLRSDQADDDVVPRVVLEATMAGRRFRIDRSPSWQRPKKRGSGLTTEQARVVISERRPTDDGSTPWHPLSTRLDETGHLVTGLLGLNLPQFCQVAMLPQGRFQAFLRARSEERHALLQQVFQTGRFDQVERWLRDRRVALRRASEAQHTLVADLVSRVSEVTSSAAPEGWTGEPVSLTRWRDDLAAEIDRGCAETAVRAEAAAAEEATAQAAAGAGIEVAGLIATHASATRQLESLRSAAPSHAADVRRLASARSAAGVRPLHDVATSARTAEQTAAAALSTADGSLAELLGEEVIDDVWVADRRREATGLLGEIARVRPLEAICLEVAREHAASTEVLETTRAGLEHLTRRLAAVPVELVGLRERCEAARGATAAVESLTSSLESWTARRAAADEVVVLAGSLDEAEAALRDVTEQRLLAREALVEIRERRLDGMAAEIACRLAVGDCCPVCGSADHPSLATRSSGAPDDVAERRARREVDDLEAVVEAHTQQVRGLETRLAAARATAGGSVEEVFAGLTRVAADLEVAVADARQAAALTEQMLRLEAEQSRLHEERDALASTATGLETTLAVLTARLNTVRADVAAVLEGRDHDDLDSLALHAWRIEECASRCLDATAEVQRARQATAQAEEHARAAALEAGFESGAQAVAAWLSPISLSALELRVEQHERDLQRVHETLADAQVSAAAAAAPPDLEALAHAHHAARAAAAATRRTLDVVLERRDRLALLADELGAALTAWEPTLADLDVVSELASFVEGKHPDNRLQMRLSAYVLAHRLGQVVASANLRLASMSDHRFSLVHTGRRGAGETRGGLSLLVRDDWSGESRDPATLSGGETFVASLALALGLADVITDEVGGADLDTLFVDEGFGSLDADTLEDVMDTLDTLRDGGRVVGVVSHVPELQTRIPTQLRVHKARHGSRTSVRLG